MQSTTKALIDAMVNRFLCWKLPKNFTPDAGIRFTPYRIQQHDGPHWPTGTNLLNAEQAREMIEHALGDAINSAALDVLAERRRQIDAEGWTPERDDLYKNGELSDAAASYALNAGVPMRNLRPPYWPWESSWWKPCTPRRDLVKAGALILAEIERLDRIQPAGGTK